MNLFDICQTVANSDYEFEDGKDMVQMLDAHLKLSITTRDDCFAASVGREACASIRA